MLKMLLIENQLCFQEKYSNSYSISYYVYAYMYRALESVYTCIKKIPSPKNKENWLHYTRWNSEQMVTDIDKVS